METYVSDEHICLRGGRKLGSQGVLQSVSACLCEEFGPYGDAWEDGYQKWAIHCFPSP